MISSLQDLVAPLSEAEFLTRLRNRRVSYLPGAGLRHFETLLDWDDLNHLIETGHYPFEKLGVLRDSSSVVRTLHLKDGRIDSIAFYSVLDHGANLILRQLNEYLPGLWKLCRRLADKTGELVSAEAVVTTVKGVLPARFEKDDTCVLHIAGSKRWQLLGPPVVNPVKSMSDQPAPQTAPIFDQVLHPGDFLFVPAGFWHRCENGPARSLHLSIFFEPPYGRDVVSLLASQLVSDATFKQPLTRYADASALAEHEVALKSRLIDQVQQWSLASFLAERAARSQKGRIDIEGTNSGQDGRNHS
jgi:ribosomal protein L16 Arg81 hydroxylase